MVRNVSHQIPSQNRCSIVNYALFAATYGTGCTRIQIFRGTSNPELKVLFRYDLRGVKATGEIFEFLDVHFTIQKLDDF